MKCFTHLSSFVLVFALACQQSSSICYIFQSKAFSERTAKGCNVRVQFEVTDACLQEQGHVRSLKVKESRGSRLYCVINYAKGACTQQTGCTCNHNSTRFALERRFRPWQSLHWKLSWELQNGDSAQKLVNISEPCSQASMPTEEPSTAATHSVSQQREQTATHTTEMPGNETEENVTPRVQVVLSSAEQLGVEPTSKFSEATEEEVTPSLTKKTNAVTRIPLVTSVMTMPWFGYALLSFIFGCILLSVVAMFAIILKRRGSSAPNNVEADAVVYRRAPRAYRPPRSSSLLAHGRCSSVPCLSVAIPPDGYLHAYSCLALDRHVLSEDLHLYSLPNSVCSSTSDEDDHVYSSPLLPRRAKSNEYISS
ncbi:uncharacterized protein [Littorina saxatilis]|uniref:uncharacterized protein n=1 Tax=Littorina saxatilis TaxID=31220 RepID=UPI0038B5EA6E